MNKSQSYLLPQVLLTGEPMKKILILAVLLTCALPLAALAQTGAATDDAAVRATVSNYLNRLKHNDVESLKLAFYPEAKLFFVKKDGQLGQLTQEQWYKSFVSSAGQEEKGDLQISAVDITGNAASVKVVEVYDTAKYSDYLSLLKLDGGWKIVNKIYVREPIKH